MKHLVALVMIAFLLPAAIPTVAMAANDNPCKDDKKKFCKDVKAAGGKIRRCLKLHKAELSAECQAFLDKQREAKKKKPMTPTQPEAAAPSQMETPAEEPVPGAENAPQ